MQAFYKRLLQKRDSLSLLEKQVLEYILAHPEKILRSNLNELSKEIFVSTATISRTCKQLGYSGFQELKYTLSEFSQQTASTLGNPPQTTVDLADQIKKMVTENQETLANLTTSHLNQGASYLKNSRQIGIFGVGASYPTCLDLARKLTVAGKFAHTYEDWDQLRALALNSTTEDLAILVSSSGETIHILEYASILKKNNVPILAVVGSKNSQLEQLADLTYHATMSTYYDGDLDMSSRIPIQLILECLLLHYLHLKNELAK